LCATETESPNHTVSGEVPIPESATPKREVESVSVGFERPPSWRAKCIIQDGEEIPASGGSTEKVELNLPSAPKRVVSMAARDGARAVCQECGEWCESPKEYAEHGCEGRVYVGWLPATEPPAEESVLSSEEFVEAVPEKLLSESESDLDGEESEPEPQLGEEVRRYCENNSPSVPEVLGRFGLAPERWSEVEALL
jgi:hypothetical protein